MVKRFCPEECFSPANWVEHVYFYAIMRSEREQTPFLFLHRFSSLLLQPFTVKKKKKREKLLTVVFSRQPQPSRSPHLQRGSSQVTAFH